MHPWYIQHLHVNSGLSPLQNNLYRIEVHMHWDHFVFLEKSGMSALPFKIHPYRILGCKLHTCDPKPRWNMLPWLGTRGVVPCIRYMFDGFFKGFFFGFDRIWNGLTLNENITCLTLNAFVFYLLICHKKKSRSWHSEDLASNESGFSTSGFLSRFDIHIHSR